MQLLYAINFEITAYFFFYKENIKDVFFIFQTKFIFKTLECVWVLEGQQIIFKNRILKKYSFSQ